MAARYETRPAARLNRGHCLVHRAELHLDSGDWTAALSDAQRACALLTDRPAQPILGAAHYLIGELHRLRGSADAAAHEYRRAGENGRDPHPGLALLRLAEGDVPSARAAIHRAVSETSHTSRTSDPGSRPKLLAAYVEIMLRADDVPAARAGTDELRELAGHADTAHLAGMSARADGAVLLAGGKTEQALGLLRRGCTIWQSLHNRAVAEQLGLRDKTVARHLSNIYAKLELRTRTAATAYAYERGLT